MPTASTPPRTLTYLPLHELTEHPDNPKTHDHTAIGNSMTQLGVIDQITRDDRTGYIISGHGRTKTLRALQQAGAEPPEGVIVLPDGTWTVGVITGWASKDDDHARAALITLNQLTTVGGWDPVTLLANLQVLAETDAELLALTTLGETDIQILLRQVEAEGVFTHGPGDMVDEFSSIAGEETSEFERGHVAKVTVYFGTNDSVESFRGRLGDDVDITTDHVHPDGWRLEHFTRYKAATK